MAQIPVTSAAPVLEQSSLTSPEGRTSLPAVRAILVGFVVLVITAGLDWLLLRDRVPNVIITDISDGVSAIIIAILSYRLFQYQRERDRAVYRRLQTIQEMNHHIRNALQVIAYSSDSSRNEKEVEAVRDAVQRITWALKEILPKV